MKRNRHLCSKIKTNCTNPRVILRPLLADSSGHGRYRFTSLPASASLFNKPDLSDIRVTVGDQSYYAHRLILCAASEVFRHMLDDRWAESNTRELNLEEDEECAKYFDKFLQYMYTGSIVISETFVLPLFMLADKYEVKPLYGECVKIIENGLKVYLVTKKYEECDTFSIFTKKFMAATSTTDESSDTDMSDHEPSSPQRHIDPSSRIVPNHEAGSSQPAAANAAMAPNALYLVASEIFPLLTVIRMLLFCHNERIKQAALYNLEARLSKQISSENYCVWNDLSEEVLLLMLKDDYFYCKEFVIFKAVKSWLQYDKQRNADAVLSEVRYAVLSHQELYEAQKDAAVRDSPATKERIQEAIRFQLFKECGDAVEEQWTGSRYEARTVREQD